MADDEIFASPRSRTVALLLVLMLGWSGAHRFYVGKTRSAVIQLLTLGGLGLWWLYDIVLIGAGSFRDDQGRLVSSWEPETDHLVTSGSAAALFDELDALRAEVSDLQERLDFAEHLLANPSRTPPQVSGEAAAPLN